MSTPEDQAAPAEEALPGEQLLDDTAAEPEDTGDGEALITTDQFLLLDDTEDLAERHGLNVVLVAGEVDCGKTTLLVAVWNTLLNHGSIADVSFAGSRTALGFERRAWLARLDSKRNAPDTERTRESENGFLHLRLSAHGKLHEVLLSDVAGETFKQVRQGTPFAEKVEWLDHTDLALFLVDGEAIAGAQRSSALSNTRRLIGQLHESGVRTRVGLVLSKAELITPELRERWDREAEVLLELARQTDGDAMLLELTARPAVGGEPTGLPGLLGVILPAPAPAPLVEVEDERSERMIGRVR
jgi:Double-GTPase 2